MRLPYLTMKASTAATLASQDLVWLRIGLDTRSGVGEILVPDVLRIGSRHLVREDMRILGSGRECQGGGEGFAAANGR